jgi:hypothetical protein
MNLHTPGNERGAFVDEGASLFAANSKTNPEVARDISFTLHRVLRVLRVSVVKWFRRFYHHGGTENTENALRQSQIRTLLVSNLS